MMGGLVLVVGGILVGYVFLGVELNYLIVVVFMFVFVGFLMVKIMLLEIEYVDVVIV